MPNENAFTWRRAFGPRVWYGKYKGQTIYEIKQCKGTASRGGVRFEAWDTTGATREIGWDFHKLEDAKIACVTDANELMRR